MPHSNVAGMDTFFYSSLGSYEFDARCEILSELGYDATYLTLWSGPAWADVSRLGDVKERHGLDVAGVYCAADIAAPTSEDEGASIRGLIERLEGCDLVELALLSGDPTLDASDQSGHERAVRWLDMLLEAAASRDITIALYPHAGAWLESPHDAVRLCEKLGHPNLGVVFSSYHWYAIGGPDLEETLAAVKPFLRSVNVCGSRRVKGWVMPATIELLDEGELDMFALLGQVRDAGYSGTIAIQGYSLAGDVYARLRRSLAAFRDIEQRLDAHQDWAVLRPDPLPLPTGAE